jgi:light-harvesting protein B-800-850 alpha chain
MNQGRIWCVVNPSLGLPLFLGGVALMSFTVHHAVMNNSVWVKDFFNGTGMIKSASAEKVVTPSAALAKAETPVLTFEVVPAAAASADSEASFVLTIKQKDPLPNPI